MNNHEMVVYMQLLRINLIFYSFIYVILTYMLYSRYGSATDMVGKYKMYLPFFKLRKFP